jgi:hypothetical protein
MYTLFAYGECGIFLLVLQMYKKCIPSSPTANANIAYKLRL